MKWIMGVEGIILGVLSWCVIILFVLYSLYDHLFLKMAFVEGVQRAIAVEADVASAPELAAQPQVGLMVDSELEHAASALMSVSASSSQGKS